MNEKQIAAFGEASRNAQFRTLQSENIALRSVLERAQRALHRACLEIGSTEGYRTDFDAILTALNQLEQRS